VTTTTGRQTRNGLDAKVLFFGESYRQANMSMTDRVFRLAAALIGTCFILLGSAVIYWDGVERIGRFVGALSAFGSGLYFLAYAITGKARLFYRK
jgi:hypothetical protein